MRKATILEFFNNTAVLRGKHIKLRRKRIQDAIHEFHWRQDAELCELDAAAPISGTFEEYVHWHASSNGVGVNSYVLAIETLGGTHIGNCGCFNIDDVQREVEIGIMIGEKAYWNHGYGEDVLHTLVEGLLQNTHVQRIYLKTLDWNVRAHKCFEKCGFKSYDRMNRDGHSFIFMEIRRPAPAPGKEGKAK